MTALNPKDLEAQTKGKARLDLLEPKANRATADALADGATKYGVQNYKRVPISFRTYLAAIQRHLDDLKKGEDLAPDSGVHHMGHILANGHVILGALEAGTLVDDRGPGTLMDDESGINRADLSWCGALQDEQDCDGSEEWSDDIDREDPTQEEIDEYHAAREKEAKSPVRRRAILTFGARGSEVSPA